MNHCRICKRPLKNPNAIALGIGPVCARKNGLTGLKSVQRKEYDDDQIQPYDGGNVWIERTPAQTLFPRGQNSYSIQPATHAASGIRTNVPRQIYKHSPTGYNFGYGGSGPSDFALNVMLLFCQQAEDAYRLYQQFKFKFVAVGGGESERLEIPRQEIEKFLLENGAALR